MLSSVKFTEADLATPQVNISYGSWYLRHLLDHYGGNEVLALAAYNAGMGNVDRWLAEGRADIPFAETRAYIDRVEELRRIYRDAWAKELGYT